MNRIFILLFGILLFSCGEKNKTNSTTDKDLIESTTTSENFDWLLGNWKRNNEEPGKETFEIWNKKNNSEYYGLGFTMQNGDTIKQESIKLIKLDGKWNLEVKAPDDTEAIIFKMTKFNKEEFICENEELEFPKLIKYWKNKSKINALVAGDGMEISFEFERISQ